MSTSMSETVTHIRDGVLEVGPGFVIGYQAWIPSGHSMGSVAARHRVLCVPGWLDNSGSMEPIGGLLAARGLLVVAMDPPGCGWSTHRAPSCSYHDFEECHLIMLVADLLRWTEPFTLCSHSRGANISLVTSGGFPHRVRACVLFDSGLGLAGTYITNKTSPPLFGDFRSFMSLSKRNRGRKPRVFASVEEAIEHNQQNVIFPKSRQIAEAIVRRHLVQHENGVTFCHDVRTYGQTQSRYIDESTLAEFLSSGRSPVLNLYAGESAMSHVARPVDLDTATGLVRDAWRFSEVPDEAFDAFVRDVRGRMSALGQRLTPVIVEGANHHLHGDIPEEVAGIALPWLMQRLDAGEHDTSMPADLRGDAGDLRREASVRHMLSPFVAATGPRFPSRASASASASAGAGAGAGAKAAPVVVVEADSRRSQAKARKDMDKGKGKGKGRGGAGGEGEGEGARGPRGPRVPRGSDARVVAEELEFEVQGQRISMQRWGNADATASPTILCWPDVWDSSASFERLARALLRDAPDADECCVVAVDPPGVAGSRVVPWDHGFGVTETAALLFDVADHLGLDDFVVVGHGAGASVALFAAGALPERVRGAVLLDPTATALPDAWAPAEMAYSYEERKLEPRALPRFPSLHAVTGRIATDPVFPKSAATADALARRLACRVKPAAPAPAAAPRAGQLEGRVAREARKPSPRNASNSKGSPRNASKEWTLDVDDRLFRVRKPVMEIPQGRLGDVVRAVQAPVLVLQPEQSRRNTPESAARLEAELAQLAAPPARHVVAGEHCHSHAHSCRAYQVGGLLSAWLQTQRLSAPHPHAPAQRTPSAKL